MATSRLVRGAARQEAESTSAAYLHPRCAYAHARGPAGARGSTAAESSCLTDSRRRVDPAQDSDRQSSRRLPPRPGLHASTRSEPTACDQSMRRGFTQYRCGAPD
eukprot:scaffold922_cov327-Pinguiococcus_pyrenoidosus.AAC.40